MGRVDARELTEPASPVIEHGFAVRDLSFSHDGTRLATAAGVNKGNSRFGVDDRARAKQRIVGVVINAVDDHLDKGDQIDAVWTMQHIRVLEPILAEAGSAGRLVVLLSDHGHMLDRQTQCREGDDGLRWSCGWGRVWYREIIFFIDADVSANLQRDIKLFFTFLDYFLVY